MMLDYFYGQSGELFSYFRIPKALFQDHRFRQLSTDARTLYGILLDRMSLSAKNGWLDGQGRVYIIYTVREVQESLCCAEHKAVKLFRELEQLDLIERKRRGLGRPSLIYVKDFSSGLPKAQVQNCPNSNSGAAESAILEQLKPQANNTDALKIDPEFQGKIPPLNAEEEHILEQNMIQERRLLNPLIIWNGYILDGHSRYRILKHHPEIAFEVKEIQLPDRYAALAWICQNQLGRRNLDPERRKFLMGKTYENEKLSVGGSTYREHDESGKFTSCRQNVHMRSTEKRTCERIANKNGVSSKFVQRAEKYAKGVDAAEAAVPGAMEEILTGHIKATDAEITALAQTPKEEIPAIIKELRKPKKDRKAKKPTSPEKSDVAADDAPDSNEVHTEDEIVPVSNSPPDFKRSIQGHKRCLTDEDRKRLRQSIDNRHHKMTVANGSIMMCEVQGAKEDFIRRWNLVFKDYPDVFEDNDCRSAILSLIDDTSAYLQTIKERVL